VEYRQDRDIAHGQADAGQAIAVDEPRRFKRVKQPAPRHRRSRYVNLEARRIESAEQILT
jgi:hypothetical protein